jgi:hypothetical protein
MIRLQSIIIPSLVLVTLNLVKACGSRTEVIAQSADAVMEDPEQHASSDASTPMDLRLVVDFAAALKLTETKLKLSEADYRQFARLIPGQFAELIDQLIQQAGIESVEINTPDALVRFNLNSEGFEVNFGIDSPLVLSRSVAIHAVEGLAHHSGGAQIHLSGIRIGDRAVKAIVFMQDTSAQLSLEDGSTIRTNALLEQFDQHTWSMPTAGQLLSSIFVLAHAISRSNMDNRIHIIGTDVDQNGKNIRESNGQLRTNSKSALRVFFRKILVQYQTSPEYLGLFDQVTEVRIDRSGMKFWLNRAAQLRFSQGSLTMSQSFSLRSHDAATILPVQGISTAAAGADGAVLQNLRIRSNGQATILDAQVYGYRKTIVGTFGKTEVISFSF